MKKKELGSEKSLASCYFPNGFRFFLRSCGVVCDEVSFIVFDDPYSILNDARLHAG